MSSGRPPQGSIPTLTEVVSWPEVGGSAPAAAPAIAPVTAALPANEAQLAQRLLEEIQKQVDLMLEVRLREALAPVLVRATDALIRDARKELTAALRDIVDKSVARELGRGDDR